MCGVARWRRSRVCTTRDGVESRVRGAGAHALSVSWRAMSVCAPHDFAPSAGGAPRKRRDRQASVFVSLCSRLGGGCWALRPLWSVPVGVPLHTVSVRVPKDYIRNDATSLISPTPYMRAEPRLLSTSLFVHCEGVFSSSPV